ncbi:MAG: hypothetical protein ABSA18_04575 [Dehalococcoidia bacterium]|jgi:hypothetical protein
MTGIIIAAVLLGIYILFLLWYYGFRRPLSNEKVEHYASIMEKRSGNAGEIIRKFGFEDDGQQFFMVSMVKYYEKPQYKNGNGGGLTSREANMRYVRNTVPMLLKRGCHPYGLFRPMINLSNIGKDELQWDEVSVVRYRSRRDFLNVVTSPRWFAGYGNKVAALQANPNFPSKGLFAFPVIPILVFTILLLIGLICMACIYFKPF